MNNGLITWKAAKTSGAKWAASVALLLGDRLDFPVLSVIGRQERLVTPGFPHYSGIGISFALKCDAHREGLAPATGKFTRRTG